MTEGEKKEEVVQLYEMITMKNDLSSPIVFFNPESNENLNLKLITLRKMFYGQELTEEERFNKNIFENLPKDADKMILN